MSGVILVTGACGFVGRHLINQLRNRQGITIVGLDFVPLPDDLEVDHYVQIDFLDPAFGKNLSSVLKQFQPKLIFHLAGVFRGPVDKIFSLNSGSSALLMQVLQQEMPTSRLVIIGSAAEYGYPVEERISIAESMKCQPVSYYGLSKLSQTEVALMMHRVFQMDVIVARPFNLVGDGIASTLLPGAILSKALDAPKNGNVMKVGNLSGFRDYLSIEDAVYALDLLAEKGKSGHIYNVCSGQPMQLQALVDCIVEGVGNKVQQEVDPSFFRASDPEWVIGDNAKLIEHVGFQSIVSVRDSISNAIRNVK